MSSGFFSAFVEGRRGEILDAALTVFGGRGYEAGTMRQIASLVGVSEPALYRHYVGKEALLVDLIETAGEHLSSTAIHRFSATDPRDVRSMLVELIAERRDLVSSNSALVTTLLVASHHNEAAREAFSRSMLTPMAAGARALIERVDAAAAIRRTSKETDGKVRAMMSLLVGHFLTSRLFDSPADDATLVANLVALMGWPEPVSDTAKASNP